MTGFLSNSSLVYYFYIEIFLKYILTVFLRQKAFSVRYSKQGYVPPPPPPSFSVCTKITKELNRPMLEEILVSFHLGSKTFGGRKSVSVLGSVGTSEVMKSWGMHLLGLKRS
jgi:hypothetical protein